MTACTNPERRASYLTVTRGFWSWAGTLDHKRIGLMYLVGVMGAFLAGGLFALLIRLHLWAPEGALFTLTNKETGAVIGGLDADRPDVTVFHAGTARRGEDVVVNGGRVLGVTALGKDVEEAREKAYERVASIRFQGMQFRRDIGARKL